MDAQQLFATALQAADGCATHIKADDLDKATPCTDWDVRALLNHIVGELLWVPAMLASKTIEEVGTVYDGDVLGDDYVMAWKQAADKAKVAVETADLAAKVHTSFGDITAEDYIMQIAGDTYIHGWDLSQAVMCSLRFDEASAQAMFDYYSPRAASWREAGAIGPEVAVAATAPIAERLLGLMGRQPMSADSKA